MEDSGCFVLCGSGEARDKIKESGRQSCLNSGQQSKGVLKRLQTKLNILKFNSDNPQNCEKSFFTFDFICVVLFGSGEVGGPN